MAITAGSVKGLLQSRLEDIIIAPQLLAPCRLALILTWQEALRETKNKVGKENRHCIQMVTFSLLCIANFGCLAFLEHSSNKCAWSIFFV